MDLLERSDELATLDRLPAECAAGGRVALVSGEAGAGKSSLAAAFAGHAGPRVRLLWGARDPRPTPRGAGPARPPPPGGRRPAARHRPRAGRPAAGADRRRQPCGTHPSSARTADSGDLP